MEYTGEKTELATPRKLEEAGKKGQFARSAEVQTVFVLLSALAAMMFAGRESWELLMRTLAGTLGHLHELPLTASSLPSYWIGTGLVLAQCTAPVLIAAMLGGLLAGGLQSRFQTASEALTVNWARLNPVTGIKRVFSFRNATPTVLAIVKLAAIVGLTYNQVLSVLADPIFYTSVNPARIGTFIADTSFGLIARVCLILVFIAAVDYTYQVWRTNRDLMMTKEEVKEETKNTEGNPQVRARQRRRRRRMTQRQMLRDAAKADVVVTNPTHLAIALRYDRKSMRAPRIVAKGARLNAQRIRQIAQKHQVPILENKPLARLMFKHGRVGAEIPAQFYAAVAEILAWVYRVNRYRYYTEDNRASA